MTQVHVSTEKRLKDFAGSAFYTENNNNKKKFPQASIYDQLSSTI